MNLDTYFSKKILKPKFLDFFKWVLIDIFRMEKRKFSEYGLTLYCGRQGSGKTLSIVEYLERMRRRYPKCLIVTNFFYKHETHSMKSWRDLLEIRNGTDGVIFALDEIHLEYNSNDWKDFPESLLSEISQQRKQRIKIVASSQVFSRVVKQLREQAFEVVETRSILGRLIFQRCFDVEDYVSLTDNPERNRKVPRKYRYSFVVSDELRNLYDTYRKVEALRTKSFLPRKEKSYGV